ncbi:MAG TPA: 16S rRNA (cytosine(1402)-N(4))-methyltransferase RsmH [Pseudogracilibacillus sp.]|nr:16S rRNA (cytosine(1402)-N(4))-methyltransferase RsmH [Pseudogracilibacillus sp.]
MNQHESVLKEEVIEQLNIKQDGIYVDCTLGRAGHSLAIAEKLSENGLLIGFDQDETAIEAAKEKLQAYPALLIHSNFRYLKESLEKHKIEKVDGILFDLGVSSPQLDEGSRGFSYRHDARLDMRMDKRQELTAYTIVNTWPYEQLVSIISRYGEERFAQRIARNIERERGRQSIETTHELVGIIKDSIPAAARRKGGHPAKRTFQALRIAVNDELASFNDALHQAAEVLKPSGRIAVLTFHSLEDRICKQAFRKWSTQLSVPRGLPIVPDEHEPPFRLITRRPIAPTQEEIEHNRRARSAKLRVVEKIKQWDERFSYEER